jgi:hypothetical protein
MEYLKKKNMLCLSKEELKSIYKNAKIAELHAEIGKRGYTPEELRADRAKLQEIVDAIHADSANDKEEIELFIAIFFQLELYPEDSRVCVIMKDGADPRKIPTTFNELKRSIKENDITDFGIFSDDGLREFQLKQYKGDLTTNDLFAFIESKVRHYGNNLGDTNLLVILQRGGEDIQLIDFEQVCHRLNRIGIASRGEILISYNEENKFDVTIRVFPELGTLRKPHTGLTL